MSDHFSLQPLLEVSRDDTERAARALGEANHELHAMQKKLDLLLRYRQEYEGRLQDSIRAGLDAGGWRNYQDFLSRLETAIARHQDDLREGTARLDQRREQLVACQQRNRSYETLLTRHQARLRQTEGRREQRETDEFAGRHHTTQRRAEERGGEPVR